MFLLLSFPVFGNDKESFEQSFGYVGVYEKHRIRSDFVLCTVYWKHYFLLNLGQNTTQFTSQPSKKSWIEMPEVLLVDA